MSAARTNQTVTSALVDLATYEVLDQYLYGTKPEILGTLAINHRRNAALNPVAVMRTPGTMEDYLNTRFIAEPLRLPSPRSDTPSTPSNTSSVPTPTMATREYFGASGPSRTSSSMMTYTINTITAPTYSSTWKAARK